MELTKEILKGESKVLEFKENMPNNESIAKTIIAFSNTSGGKLLIGVSDKREIIGIDKNLDIFDIQDKVASIIYDNCYPTIIPEIYTSNIDGKIIMVIEVFRGNLIPYFMKKYGENEGVYIRVGATNRKASFENILDLERQSRRISFDEEINYDEDFGDMDITPVEKRFRDMGKTLDLEKLKNLKLIKVENGRVYATNGLSIILGTFENCMVKCSRFKGTSMDVFLDKKEYIGDLFSQIDKIEGFIKSHIKLKSEIKGLQRKDILEIPIEAIREAIVNAIVHRDYANKGRDVKVGIYDDILNIVSPGGFPSTITEEDIISGRSEVRNKVIARVFKELNYIEQWGSGINRIKSSCIKHGLKEPLIKETGDFVSVEIYRELPGSADKVPGSADKVPGSADKNIDLSDQEVKVLNYLKDNAKVTTSQTMKLCSVKERRARIILKGMVEKRLLRVVGKGRATCYTVNNLDGQK
ncbi:divergent AAA domain protein [Andreesenia angusta]|uniref:Divergent AAA domain protein n=1 Tax=Andreesenia angusta TaxID=39480 RepID=A0A1S1V637_9FIRM|nr:RNA-binding domain-containing protein [Andreesenia angusta]OHW61567.1 divergent AAA domain protein [Andreesenia angusta]